MGSAFGRLFRLRGQRSATPTTELGTSGAFTSGGFLVSTERNKELRGRARYETFSDLLANVAIVAAGVRAFLNLLSNSAWTVSPADTDNEADAKRAQEAADLVDDVIHDLQRPWSRVVRRSGMYRFYGFSIQEWTAKRRPDGAIGLLDVAPRPQSTIERWALDEAGNVEGCTQTNPGTLKEVFLPRSKIIHIVDDALSDSPEGFGLFRHLVASNQRLQRYQLLEAFGFETDLKGIPVARIPYGKLRAMVGNNFTEQQRKDAIKPLEDFIHDHIKNPELGIALDSAPYRDTGESESPSSTLEWDIKLMMGSPTSAAEVASAIERLTREMALVLGVQGLLLGGDGSGSLALGRVFSEQFAQLVDSGLRELGEAYEADLIPVVCRLNGIPEELWPGLVASLAQHRDVDQITAAIRDLADSGAVLAPDDPAINAVREMLGLPLADLDKLAEDAALRASPVPPPPDPDLPEPPEPEPPGPEPDPPEPEE